jgi:hypothetical protein
MTATDALSLLAGLFALATLILIAMAFLFAQLIGWRSLARRYAAVGVAGDRFSSKGVVIGAHSWNAPPLFVKLDDLGITLVPKSPFRIAFSAVRIPWRVVQSFETRSYMLFEVVELRFGTDATSVIGFIPSKATEAIAGRLSAIAAPEPSRP